MVLNYLWIAFFLIAFVVGLVKLIFFQDTAVFPAMVGATFEMARTGFEISLGLTGVMALWLGLMRIGERAGMIDLMARAVGPFFQRLFPGIPPNHPVTGAMLMNFSANLLGLDNAATPLGLKAMKELQTLNPSPDTASDAQIMFLVLNTSGLTLIPVSVMTYRAQLGAANPADIFLPILLTTFFSSLVGLVAVALYQRINLFDRVIVAYLGSFLAVIGLIIYYFQQLSPEQVGAVSAVAGNLILFGIIAAFIGLAAYRRIPVYDTFIEGAKEGFGVAITIIPYLIAILVAVGVFRACGALDYVMQAVAALFAALQLDTNFVPALPTALMKPLSGSGARGLMIDAMNQYGADSFAGRAASTIQGATDTTFYILAVYFGAINVRKTRYALSCGLLADFTGIVVGILMAYLFFG